MHTALIVAAGTSSRMKSDQSKVLTLIHGKPLFRYSVDTFLSLGFKVVLVVSKKDYQSIKSFITDDIIVVHGGKTRSESVQNGLKEVVTPYVYIHDAARPLVTKTAILKVSEALSYYDAVCLCEPLTSALKQKHNQQTISVDRDAYLLAQTPQAFLTEKIRSAHLRNQESFDDDIALYQHVYKEEHIEYVYNDDSNIKVTYANDLAYVKHVLKEDMNMRIGHSFDIHQLSESRPLILGGLHIPHEKGLLGHSDADVLLHVIGESIMGALALGDLGTLFPDSDQAIKDISSIVILKEIKQKMSNLNYGIINIDATVYAEQPKLNPYILKLRENVANILEIELNKVSIKATTYEKLDAIGQEKAIAAEAVVLLKEV